ncbi:MAG: restriction endonuclease subunit S [Syntrophobacteraceae bacterium]
MTFIKATLGEIAATQYGLVDGPFGSDLPARLYTDEGIPVVRGVNLSLGDLRFNDGNYKYVSPETADQLKRSNCYPGDIVFTKKGTIGQTGLIPLTSRYKRFLLSSNQMKITLRRDVALPEYVYYYVSSPDIRRRIIAESTSCGVPKTNVTYLRAFPILLPPLTTQCKIAAILSAYDDLIENNLRRIKILEEMAQNLYREWFVKFRFPGHQHARFTDSPLGRIPEGWQAIRFADLLASGLGGDWGLDEPDDKEDAPVFVIRGTDFNDVVTGTSLRTPKRFIAPSSQEKRQLRVGDLLVENSVNAKSRCVGTTLLITDGILGRLRDPAIAASFCKVYRFKDPSLAALAHLHMRHLRDEGKMAFYQNVAANGIGNFQSQRFLESEHLIFPLDLQERRNMLDFLGFLTTSILADQAFTLRRTRDLLLPRLISGEVDVSELDIAVPEEAGA